MKSNREKLALLTEDELRRMIEEALEAFIKNYFPTWLSPNGKSLTEMSWYELRFP